MSILELAKGQTFKYRRGVLYQDTIEYVGERGKRFLGMFPTGTLYEFRYTEGGATLLLTKQQVEGNVRKIA